jgi:hypothetical protein
MKQSKVILLILVFLSSSLFFVCCSKNTISEQSDIENFSAATKQVLNSKTLLELKQSYSLLSNDEKQILWATKLDAILRNSGAKLSVDQRNIINSLKTFVDKKTFEKLSKDPTAGELFIAKNLPYFEKHFSKPELYLLIECPYFCNSFSIEKSMDYLSVIDKKQVAPELENKTSSIDELEPIDGDGGSKCTCYYSIYCQIGGGGGGTCNTGGCAKIKECGLFGNSNCTGSCA